LPLFNMVQDERRAAHKPRPQLLVLIDKIYGFREMARIWSTKQQWIGSLL